MKIKVHWGIAIAISYSVFVLLLVTYVVFSSMQKVDLVESNYYNKELNYQKQIDKIARTKRLPEKLKLAINDRQMNLKFPEIFKGNGISGRINFYRPSDASLDKNIGFILDTSSNLSVDLSEFKKGFWKLKIDWSVGDSSYYNEEFLSIN